MKNYALKRKDIFQKDQYITFLMPKIGKVKGQILGTDYMSQSGFTVSLLVQNYGLMYINEKFLEKLVLRAK